MGVETASTDAVDLNDNGREVGDEAILFSSIIFVKQSNQSSDRGRGDETRSNVVNDLPSLISILRSDNDKSNALRTDTTTNFYSHKDDAPTNT